MEEPLQTLRTLAEASPVVLALLVALAVVGLSAFAIWAVLSAYKRRDSQ